MSGSAFLPTVLPGRTLPGAAACGFSTYLSLSRLLVIGCHLLGGPGLVLLEDHLKDAPGGAGCVVDLREIGGVRGRGLPQRPAPPSSPRCPRPPPGGPGTRADPRRSAASRHRQRHTPGHQHRRSRSRSRHSAAGRRARGGPRRCVKPERNTAPARVESSRPDALGRRTDRCEPRWNVQLSQPPLVTGRMGRWDHCGNWSATSRCTASMSTLMRVGAVPRSCAPLMQAAAKRSRLLRHTCPQPPPGVVLSKTMRVRLAHRLLRSLCMSPRR